MNYITSFFMKSFFSKILIVLISLSVITESVSAYGMSRYRSRTQSSYYNNRGYVAPAPQYNNGYNTYNNYQTPVVSCPNFSNASVSIGTLPNGLNISVSSYDSALQTCIRSTAWASYFTRFGNSVNFSVVNTTLGVQMTATSYDSYTISSIQNTSWVSIINGIQGYSYSPYYNQPQYSYPQYQNNPSYNYNNNPYYYNNQYQYNPPVYDNSSRRGSVVFGNTNQIARSLTYVSNGVQMNFTSNDYNTMNYLQRFSFTYLFSHLGGVSVSQSNISGGIQVTVTSGSTSTIQEIQNIGSVLVYQ